MLRTNPFRSRGARAIAAAILVISLAVAVSRLDLRPDLRHVHVAMLSGTSEGNYHVMVEATRTAAARKRGRIDNVTSAGSVENIQRLAAAAGSCDVQVALVQAGLPMPASPQLELLGRLGKAESFFLLGKKGDQITDFGALAGLRVGIGPEGSGTALAARQIFGSRDLKGLGIALSNHATADQLALAEKGDLDLAVFVMDEDAALIERAVRDRGLQIVGFKNADVVARRFPFVRHGRIGAGQYDAVRMLPPVDKQVLRIDTLVVGNGCARRSQVMGLLSSLSDVYPDFIRHNRETPNTSGLELASAAKNFWDNSGPELLDYYFPRISDVMPPNNWVHLVMGLSVLFNLMGLANRFALWRIDAGRVRAEHEIGECFGPAVTLGDIARMDPEGDLLRVEIRSEIDRVIKQLEDLAARCRRISLSVLVPMGSEMAYRYQENLIHETLAVLRAFRERWQEAKEKDKAA